MAYFMTTTAHGTTGVKTLAVGFTPVGMRITVGQKFGTSQTFVHWSSGVAVVDAMGPYQRYDSLYWDSTGGQTKSGDTRLISHYDRVAGSLSEVLAVAFDSFTATQVKYNVLTANVNYTLVIEAWD